MVQPDQARWDAAGEGGEDNKLGRSPGLNLVRAGRSDCHVFAYVEKRFKEDIAVKKIGNISKIENYPAVHVACLTEPNGFAREDAVMGYWTYYPANLGAIGRIMPLQNGSSKPNPLEK